MKQAYLAGMMALGLLAMAGFSEAAISVSLTVTERAQVERTGELASGGVPLPRGAVKDVDSFVVVGVQGKTIPAQFTVLNRWPSDASVRWMLVQFPVSLGAGETKSFTLKQGGRNPKPTHTLSVTEGKDVVNVDTGVLRFTVKKRGFALFDTVTIQDKSGRSRKLGPALCGEGFVVKPLSGGIYTTASDVDSKVTLEDVGPLRATIRVDGKHKEPSGKSLFSYRVRICATAGSRAVRVQYVFTYDEGPWSSEPVEVKELSLTLKPKFSGAVAAHLGGTGKTHATVLDDSAQVRQLVKTSESYALSGALAGSGTAKVAKDLNLGWCALTGNNLSVTAAVRWFWQLYPKAYTLKGDGELKVELVPPDASEPAHIYRGMSKTHDLLFVFDSKKVPARELAVGFQKPLFVKCPPAWYCQETLGMGRLVSSDYEGIRPEFAQFVKVVDEGFNKQIDYIHQFRDRVIDRARQVDSFGMVHFGDGFHHATGSGHRNLQWDNCYYSYTHLLAMQFARTGNDRILDTLREAATYEGDVGIGWDSAEVAAPRVCPGAYHIGGFDDFRNSLSGSWNFYKPIGMMELFYLTGDRRHQDAALANFNWTLTHDGYDIYHNPRSVGAGLRALVHGYLATGNESYLYIAREVARKTVRFYQTHGHFAPISNSRFMCPNALEGLCAYHELTGDEQLGKVLPAMVSVHFQQWARGAGHLWYVYPNLYSAALAGDKELKNLVEQALAQSPEFGLSTGNHNIKDFAISKRGVPLVFWYLSDLAESPPKPWGRVKLGPEQPDRQQVSSMKAPRLDGKLTGGEWEKASAIDLVYNPDPTQKLTAHTRLRLGYDAENLYLAIEAREPRLERLKLSVTEDGGPTWADDCVEIYVGPGSRRVGVKLAVNAAGFRNTGVRGHYPDELAAVPPGDFPVAAGRTRDAWILEITLPWDKIGISKPRPGTEVAFNVLRFRVGKGLEKTGERLGEMSTWHGSTNQIESGGTLVLSP